MPTEAYTVYHVASYEVRGGHMRHEITLMATAPQVHDTIVSTLNPWAASLCERAKALGARVSVGWKDSRFGPELVTATLLTNPPQSIADVQAAAYLSDPTFAEERK